MYTPSKKEIWVSILAGVLALGAFVTAICLVYSEVERVKQDSSKIGESNLNLEQAFYIKKEMNDQKENIAIVNSFFLKNGDEPSVIGKIEDLGRAHGLKAQTDAVSEDPVVVGIFTSLKLEVSFQGSLSQIIAFVTDLGNLPYAIKVQDVDVRFAEDIKTWTGKVAVSLYKIK